jgi:hypothetical protein
MTRIVKSLKYSFGWLALLLLAGWLFFFYLDGCGDAVERVDPPGAVAAPETVIVYRDRIIEGKGYARKEARSDRSEVYAPGVDSAPAPAAPVVYCYDDSLLSLELTTVGDSLRVSYWIKLKERELHISEPYPVYVQDTAALRLYVGSVAGSGLSGVSLQVQSERVTYVAGYNLAQRAPYFGINIRLFRFERRRIRNIFPVRLKRRPEMGVSGLLTYESAGST